jgi:hypothetical protein
MLAFSRNLTAGFRHHEGAALVDDEGDWSDRNLDRHRRLLHDGVKHCIRLWLQDHPPPSVVGDAPGNRANLIG